MKLSAAKIKEIRALQEKKRRAETSLFVVEGEKMAEEALKSDFEVVELYKISEIGEEAMGRISSFKTPSPALTVVRQKEWSVTPCESGLYIALDGVRDPGNLGTIIRLADWFGVNGILLSKGCVELYNPKCIQATMGAIFRVPTVYVDLPQTITEWRNNNVAVYGTLLNGRDIGAEWFSAVKKEQKGRPVTFVMGSESFGISKEVESLINEQDRIRIPSFKTVTSESLNVATATAVILSLYRL